MDSRQLQLLHEIMALEFTAIELNLYLDTHPEEQEPLNDYNQVTERLNQLKAHYEHLYGPLVSYGFSPSEYPWRWIEEPWPWEIQF
ncbi:MULTISPECIES: spore coat protein CotJB [Desulfofundulus]|uniref:Spore coat protein JB n=1 Tax=Desulfofundulus australicus DSM 11792 TaxID=1121425 RepID=A0A1M5ADE9_9FIRM|nr:MULTISPECIES: spore coat protein CotJB [Desulfofundulus]MBE3584646.1 spore coat protein CotJB [Thermoanaerobacter sp.]MCS5694741.1 spore coat protein CotJB [Desulfofundulus thermocisternus]MDK2887617.1 spore coat protein [Thermoanaerobacter sp.]SHF28175.1 spore coat protein JB [Desulfofundulus australicus DSM 11792]